MTLRKFKQACGLAVLLVSVGLMYVFVRSEAWFGVMIGLFMGAVGVKAILQPDFIFRAGSDDDETPSAQPPVHE